MKLVIAATPKVAIPTIEALKDLHEITLVTQPDRPAGRGKQLRASEIATAYHDVLKPESESALAEILQGADLLITIGYGRLLSKETLAIPKFGGINLHFSLLPRWRGAAPVQRTIEAGEKFTGVTVFQMDEGMDTGPIWVQSEFSIPYGFSATQLFESLATIGSQAVVEALTRIISHEAPKPQSGSASIARKITKAECKIDWSQSAELIIRKIKAFGPNPGMSSIIRGIPIKIDDARISEEHLTPGELSQSGAVGTGSNAILLLTVTPAGKRMMSAKDWLNGFKPMPGEKFE